MRPLLINAQRACALDGARITGPGERVPTLAFTGLKSHFLFEARFGRPGKGNDKGEVEGLVKYARAPFHDADP